MRARKKHPGRGKPQPAAKSGKAFPAPDISDGKEIGMASLSVVPKQKTKCPIHGCYSPLIRAWVPVGSREVEVVNCTKCNWGGLTTGRNRPAPKKAA